MTTETPSGRPDDIVAPWTPAQVRALNDFQRSGRFHPFTCGNDDHRRRPALVADETGWHCPDQGCGYQQTWAHSFMADPAVSHRFQIVSDEQRRRGWYLAWTCARRGCDARGNLTIPSKARALELFAILNDGHCRSEQAGPPTMSGQSDT